MMYDSMPGYEISSKQIEQYHREGYLIVRQLFSPDDVEAIKAYFAEIAQGPPIQGLWSPDLDTDDPLKRWPRIVHPHRWQDACKKWFLANRISDVLKGLFDEEPLGVQSMYYFKPPGAKGQALHQDDFYLNTQPNPCIAAWTAIDPSTPDNGGLYVVPGSHQMDIVCPELADQDESFTTHFVKPPPGLAAIPAALEPGDTLFFAGNVIHGSKPNSTSDTWRRSFICHYIARSTEKITKWFQPILTFDGDELALPASGDGGPCGEEFWAFWDGLSEDRKKQQVHSF